MSIDRRGFLRLLAQTAVASTVAYSFPSIIVPKNIVQVTTWGEIYSNVPRGMSYIIDTRPRVLQGLDTAKFVIHPFWKEINGIWAHVHEH